MQPIGPLRRPARENRMIERHFLPHRWVRQLLLDMAGSLAWMCAGLACRRGQKLPLVPSVIFTSRFMTREISQIA